MRSLHGPAFLPLRILSNAYTDIFRAVPGIVVIFLLGFGIPGLGIIDPRTDQRLFGILALAMVYSAYVAEVYRAGINSIHPSQDAAARSLGLSRLQSLRHVVIPQAVRRVIPPLLNDFIGLQKDTVLVSFIGVVEIFRLSQIDAAGTYNFTPYVAVALVFIVITVPLIHIVDWLIARYGTVALERGRPVTEALRIEDLHKSFGKLEVLRGSTSSSSSTRSSASSGRPGSGKSTLLRCINLLEPIDAGRILLGGDEITADRVDRRPDPPPDRDRLPGVQPLPAPVGPRQRDARPAQRPQDAARARPRPRRSSCSNSSGWPTSDASSRSAVGRPAAAGGDRPGAGHAARPAAP